MSSNLFLVLRAKGHPPFATRLPLGDLTIGRSNENDISLPLETISRTHARLTVGKPGVIITDLKSTNGTFVNRKRVQCASVFPGDSIQLGNVQLVLSLDPNGMGGLDPEEITQNSDEFDKIEGDTSTSVSLTPAQTEVFNLLVLGHLQKEIADLQNRSESTINNHVRKIFEAYGVHSKVELLLKVMPR